MSLPLKPIFALGVSLFAGAAFGILTSPRVKSSEGGNGAKFTQEATAIAKRGGPVGGKETEISLQNVSQNEGFGVLELEKQKDVLVKLKERYGKQFPPSVQLTLARMFKELSADQTARLIEALPSGKEADAFTQRLLVESLAASDPQRALEIGRKLKDNKIIGYAVTAVAQRSGKEALELVFTLSEAERQTALREMTSPVWPSHFNGSVQDAVEILRQSANLKDGLDSGKDANFSGLLGKIVGQEGVNAETALATIRGMVGEGIQKTNPSMAPEELDAKVNGFVKNTANTAYRALLGDSPPTASKFFDALPEAQKDTWLTSVEAVSRFKTQGQEAAIQLAERQGSDELIRQSASGMWVALAQQDRAAAYNWVAALPEGPFRQGVFRGVMVDAFREVSSFTALDNIISVSSARLSPQVRLEYFSELVRLTGENGDHWNSPSQSEMIARLPVSDAEKQELIRRFAPIKP